MEAREAEPTGVAIRTKPQLPAVPAELSVEDVLRQSEKIHEIMKTGMQKGVHYGVIPGTNRPSLWQAGAEKLCLLFRLAPEYTVEKEHNPEATRPWKKKRKDGSEYSGVCKGFIRYTVICRLSHGPTGTMVASGTGTANNWEPKFISRDPYEVEETIIQFSRKRSLVNATRTGTAASDIFTQDDDIVPDSRKESGSQGKTQRQTFKDELHGGLGFGDTKDSPKEPDPQPGTDTDPLGPGCPICKGPIWDNREQRRQDEAAIKAGTRSKKARPAGKCKNSANCNGLIWTCEEFGTGAKSDTAGITEQQTLQLRDAQARLKLKPDAWANMLKLYEVDSGANLTAAQAEDLLVLLRRMLADQGAGASLDRDSAIKTIKGGLELATGAGDENWLAHWDAIIQQTGVKLGDWATGSDALLHALLKHCEGLK